MKTPKCEQCNFFEMVNEAGEYVCKAGRSDRACCLVCENRCKCRCQFARGYGLGAPYGTGFRASR